MGFSRNFSGRTQVLGGEYFNHKIQLIREHNERIEIDPPETMLSRT